MTKTPRYAPLALAMLFGATPAVQGARECRVAPPTDLAKRPTHWLGDCPRGRAEGIGVIRAGTGEPFDFFLGEMRNGAPVKGMVVLSDSAEVVTRFGAAQRNATPRSGDPNEYHAIWVLATRAAMMTAQHFTAIGNRGSAAYYQRLAKKIRDREPE